MKKLICTLALMLYATNTMAETIVVIDDNGVVKSQMSTNTVITQPTVIQPVVTTTPSVTVVRESPVQTNSYYYDNYSTGSAILAGVTTAVVGALLFDGFKPHHHHSTVKIAPAHHHSSSKIAPASHHGGKPHHK